MDGAVEWIGPPLLSRTVADAAVSLDRLFDDWCAYCGAPRGARNQVPMSLDAPSVRAHATVVSVRSPDSVAMRHFGRTTLLSMPRYETLVFSSALRSRLQEAVPRVDVLLRESEEGLWELCGEPVVPCGCDSVPRQGTLSLCPECRRIVTGSLVRLDVCVSEGAVSGDHELTSCAAIVVGYANLRRLVFRPDVARLLFPSRSGAMDRVRVTGQGESFELDQYLPQLVLGE